MAESVISGLVQTIIENLGSQILQEIGKILDVKNELAKLGNTVSRIHAVLKEYSFWSLSLESSSVFKEQKQ